MTSAKSDSSFRDIAKSLPKRESVIQPAQEESPVKLDHRGMVRQTIYMPPGVYEAVRDVAHAKHLSQQGVWREAMSLYLSTVAGIGTWDELDNRPESLKKKGRE